MGMMKKIPNKMEKITKMCFRTLFLSLWFNVTIFLFHRCMMFSRRYKRTCKRDKSEKSSQQKKTRKTAGKTNVETIQKKMMLPTFLLLLPRVSSFTFIAFHL